jgi:hypothetical protein
MSAELVTTLALRVGRYKALRLGSTRRRKECPSKSPVATMPVHTNIPSRKTESATAWDRAARLRYIPVLATPDDDIGITLSKKSYPTCMRGDDIRRHSRKRATPRRATYVPCMESGPTFGPRGARRLRSPSGHPSPGDDAYSDEDGGGDDDEDARRRLDDEEEEYSNHWAR